MGNSSAVIVLQGESFALLTAAVFPLGTICAAYTTIVHLCIAERIWRSLKIHENDVHEFAEACPRYNKFRRIFSPSVNTAPK